MNPSALATHPFLPQTPSGLLACEDPSSPEKENIRGQWRGLLSKDEVRSRTFTFERGIKGDGWSCKIHCTKITEIALRIFLRELAARPGVTWLSFNSPAFDDRKVSTTAVECEQLPDLKVIYWEGPFTNQGSMAIMDSLQRVKGPLEIIFMHGYPTQMWGVGETYRESRAALPTPAVLAGRDEGELLAERLIQETTVPQTETELAETWRALFDQGCIRGSHLYWERLDQDDGAVVACRIKSRTMHPKVLASLIPFLIEGVSTLTLSVDFVDNERMELIAHAIAHFRGGLHLTLGGDFSDQGAERLVQAIRRSPSVIQGFNVKGNYSWDMIERLQEVASDRVLLKNAQICIPPALQSFAFREEYQRFLKKRSK